MPNLSIVIPCFNEAGNIPALVNKLESIKNTEIEVILVNNGSTDETANILSMVLVDKYPFLKSVMEVV